MVIVDSQWFSDCSSRRFSQVFNRSCRSHLFLVVVVASQWFSVVFTGSRTFSVVLVGSLCSRMFSLFLSGFCRFSMFLSASCHRFSVFSLVFSISEWFFAGSQLFS